MRPTIALGTGIAAGVTALALVGTPALAQNGPWSGARSSTDTTCPMLDETATQPGTAYGMGRGNGMRNGTGMQGMGAGTVTAPSGTLTSSQKTALVDIADDEKLAHDVYTVLAAKFPNEVQFSRIVRAESMHLTAIRILLTRYGIADPTVELPAGSFANAATTSLYTSLLAGATSDASALAAGVAVEKTDLADLNAARAGITAPDVVAVYTHLLTASQRHLAAFGG